MNLPISRRSGDVIPSKTYRVTREMINVFGDIANDHNPVHFDDEFARTRGFSGAIAHGSISAALIIEMLAEWLPDWPIKGDVVDIKFVAPVLVGTDVNARGIITSVAQAEIRCDVWCETADAKKVTVGTVRLALPRLPQT
jgi:3-hydroxybutyryl-CoA dehydratase